MLGFIIGLFLGCFIGVVVMCVLSAKKNSDVVAEDDKAEKK